MSNLFAELTEIKLAEFDIKITEREKGELRNYFQYPGERDLVGELMQSNSAPGGLASDSVLASRTASALRDSVEYLQDFSEGNVDPENSLFKALMAKLSSHVVELISERGGYCDKSIESDIENFRHALERLWGESLQDLQLFVHAVDDLLGRRAAYGIAAQSGDIKATALLRSGSKAIRVAKEIVLLLKFGYAEGAMTRWRTLHEVAVASKILSEGDENTAACFLDHAAVDAFKMQRGFAEALNENCTEIDHREYKKREEEYFELIERHGEAFKLDYGWAAGFEGLKRPTFKKLEASAGLQRFRIYYSLSCSQVHASSSGMHPSMLIESSDSVALSGPSVSGLAMPATLSAESLLIVLSAVLSHYPDCESTAALHGLNGYLARIKDKFNSCEQAT